MDDAEADPMAAAVAAAPRGFQDIRALPVQAGGAVFFTHRVIHWGSASRAGYPTPRIACSWAAPADDYEQPYFSRYDTPAERECLHCRNRCVQQLTSRLCLYQGAPTSPTFCIASEFVCWAAAQLLQTISAEQA